MKKIATWLAVLSIIVFVIDWGIGGLLIYESNYENKAWIYIGLVSFVVFFCSLLYLKTANRCPHCGKSIQVNGKFCPHCGKEIN